MIEHKIPRGVTPRIRQTTLLVILPLLIAAGCLGAWIGAGRVVDPNVVAAMVMFLVIVAAAVLIGFGVGKRSYTSYRLIEGEDGLTRTQDGLPPMTIPYGDISRIAEYGKQGLRVYGQGPQQHIDVPGALRDYAGVRERLNARHTIENIPQADQAKTLLFAILVGLLAVAAVIIFRTSRDWVWVVITGALLLVGGIEGILVTFRSPQSLGIVKWGSLLLLFPMLFILVRMITVIAGQ